MHISHCIIDLCLNSIIKFKDKGESVKTITEPSRQIPVKYEVDVVVAGSGPAGFSAALSAARSGAKTLIIEQFGDIGGVSTVGLMSHWTGGTKGGLYEEILTRSNDLENPLSTANQKRGCGRATINPERLKTVYLQMLQEAGVQILLYTQVVDCVMEGDTIRGVILESKSGREAVLAKQVIDCTGDGDVAARAGAPFYKGREEDGKMQPMTLMFKVAGVDYEKAVLPPSFESNFDVPLGKVQDLAREHIPFPAGHCLLYPSSLPGIITCNMTNIVGVDGTKVEDLTQAHIACRMQMEEIIRFLHKYVPGFENCYIISSANFIGIRETRHFEGEKTITKEDILQARVFEDWAVTYAHFNFDVHGISKPGLDETGAQKHFTQAKGYTIPYGCLVPKKIDNLLLAGRNISGSHLAHSNYRAMPICANLGQAAGAAAALCARNGCTPRKLDVKLLQQTLLAAGVLDPSA